MPAIPRKLKDIIPEDREEEYLEEILDIEDEEILEERLRSVMKMITDLRGVVDSLGIAVENLEEELEEK